MWLHVKNMVCDRCKSAVQAKLLGLGLHPVTVNLGQIFIQEEELQPNKIEELSSELLQMGFELLEDPKQKVTEAIKAAIIDLVHYQKQPLQVNLSTYLAEKLDIDYQNLSATFSEQEKSTIEKYFIAQKIELVKELLSYGTQTLSEIAYQLNYSSVAHLSAQFKKVTGLTPSQYKNSVQDRQTLDRI